MKHSSPCITESAAVVSRRIHWNDAHANRAASQSSS